MGLSVVTGSGSSRSHRWLGHCRWGRSDYSHAGARRRRQSRRWT